MFLEKTQVSYVVRRHNRACLVYEDTGGLWAGFGGFFVYFAFFVFGWILGGFLGLLFGIWGVSGAQNTPTLPKIYRKLPINRTSGRILDLIHYLFRNCPNPQIPVLLWESPV